MCHPIAFIGLSQLYNMCFCQFLPVSLNTLKSKATEANMLIFIISWVPLYLLTEDNKTKVGKIKRHTLF